MKKILVILFGIIVLIYTSYDCIFNNSCGFGRAGREVPWGTLTGYFKILINGLGILFLGLYLLYTISKSDEN